MDWTNRLPPLPPHRAGHETSPCGYGDFHGFAPQETMSRPENGYHRQVVSGARRKDEKTWKIRGVCRGGKCGFSAPTVAGGKAIRSENGLPPLAPVYHRHTRGCWRARKGAKQHEKGGLVARYGVARNDACYHRASVVNGVFARTKLHGGK